MYGLYPVPRTFLATGLFCSVLSACALNDSSPLPPRPDSASGAMAAQRQTQRDRFRISVASNDTQSVERAKRLLERWGYSNIEVDYDGGWSPEVARELIAGMRRTNPNAEIDVTMPSFVVHTSLENPSWIINEVAEAGAWALGLDGPGKANISDWNGALSPGAALLNLPTVPE